MTSTFYSKPTYEIVEDKVYTGDFTGQLALNTFYELAKGEGFNSFGIGNGVLHIDAREKGKGMIWVYNYNVRGTDNSSVIANTKKNRSVDLWKPDGKESIKMNQIEWIQQIWSKFKHQMPNVKLAARPAAIEGGQGYDYLPHDFKSRAGIDANDKNFVLNDALRDDQRNLASTAREEVSNLLEQNLRSSEFNKLFVNNFKIVFNSKIIDAIEKSLGEGKTISTLTEVEKNIQYTKALEKNGLKNLENYIYKDISIFNDVKRTKYESFKEEGPPNLEKEDEELENSEFAIKPFDNVPAKISKIKDSKRIELKYTSLVGNLVEEFELPGDNLTSNQWPRIEDNSLDIELKLKISYSLKYENYTNTLFTDDFFLRLNVRYEVYPQIINTLTNQTTYKLLVNLIDLTSIADIEDRTTFVKLEYDEYNVASIKPKEESDILDVVNIKEIEAKIGLLTYKLKGSKYFNVELEKENNGYIVPVLEFVTDTIQDYFLKDIFKIEVMSV